MFSLFTTILIAASALYLGFLVLRYGRYSPLNRNFFMLTIFTTTWILASYLENEGLALKNRIIFLHIDFMAALLVGHYFFRFSYSFVRRESQNRMMAAVHWLLTSIATGLILGGKLTNNIFIEQQALNFTAGWGFLPYALIMILNFGGGLFMLIRAHADSRGLRRKQSALVLAGFTISIIITLSINLLLQEYLSVALFRLGCSASMFFIIFTSIAIIKHGLFDVRNFLQRSFVYSILFGILVLIYLSLIFLINFWFGPANQLAILISAGITAVVGAFTIQPLQFWFRKKTDFLFYKDKYDYKAAVFAFTEIFNNNIDLVPLLDDLSLQIKEIFRTNNVYVLFPKQNMIFDNQGNYREMKEKVDAALIEVIESGYDAVLVNREARQMAELIEGVTNSRLIKAALAQAEYIQKKFKIVLTVPILLQGKLTGFLALGAKKSGDMYTEEDINLLKTVSAQAAVAMEKARLYNKVKNYSSELEDEVRRRTAKIEGLQKEQKQMMLEIAHGLQTPLTIIKGELEVIAAKSGNQEQIRSVEHSLERITKFVYDMLRLAKMESEGKEFKKETFDLSGLFKDLVEEYEVIAAAKDIQVKAQIEDGIRFYGDKAQIEELITNLVSNSVKYIGVDGDKEIMIKLSRQDKTVTITVQDTGIGIKKEDQARLFTRFYRAGSDLESKVRGTGLGLAISRQIVERHNGRIELESGIGQGTAFNIYLPL